MTQSSFHKWEKRLIKYGMFVILGIVLAIYYMSKFSLGDFSEHGPPPPDVFVIDRYQIYRDELFLWYEKIGPALAPFLMIWFNKWVERRYERDQGASATYRDIMAAIKEYRNK